MRLGLLDDASLREICIFGPAAVAHWRTKLFGRGGRTVLLQQGLPLPSLALPPAWRFAASSPGGKHPRQAACARSFLAALGRSCDDRFRCGATRAVGLRGRGRSHVMWHSVLSERRRKFHMSRSWTWLDSGWLSFTSLARLRAVDGLAPQLAR
ncbi:unnamed protein product [Effrenium voratum]|uniref:Uncharacterized protein n=1 Tax=Effrenium voratum TaxID=2562239 RepID=A0AA36IVA6_9DINO|nr:unnamed protein product [Effrenium voratum]